MNLSFYHACICCDYEFLHSKQVIDMVNRCIFPIIQSLFYISTVDVVPSIVEDVFQNPSKSVDLPRNPIEVGLGRRMESIRSQGMFMLQITDICPKHQSPLYKSPMDH